VAGVPPLQIAVRNRNEALVKRLLAGRADVNRPDDKGRTALFWAADAGWHG
jgi:ankyrin repeat protein